MAESNVEEWQPMDGTYALHNVAEFLSETTGERRSVGVTPLNLPEDAIQLQRVPESVRRSLNEVARDKMLHSTAMEIRFVAEGSVRVTLSSGNAEGRNGVEVFRGDFHQVAERSMLGPDPVTLDIDPLPQIDALLSRLDDAEGDGAEMARSLDWTFHPRVCRVRLPTHAGPLRLHAIEPANGGSCRAPHPDELPGHRLLAYGTSITHGASATSPEMTYAALTAYRLRADLINLGSGGSAQCERELADYIASRDDWDLAILALSVNMRGFSQEEYRRRIAYMIRTVAGAHPLKPVFAITLWPFFCDLGFHGGAWRSASARAPRKAANEAKRMRQDLRDVVADASLPNTHLLEGPELFGPLAGLTTDLIHPSNLGMMAMAERLATAVESQLPTAP